MAAGRGSRNDSVRGLHKALLPIENRAAISRIIEKIDKDVEVVVALGYRSDQVRSYFKTVHHDRIINFVEVDNYDSAGSGPGYSLLCCRGFLNCPFVFTSVDTILGDDDFVENFSKNWIGVSKIDDPNHKYCLINSDGNKFKNFYFGEGSTAFIGIAGVYDYKNFWNALENSKIINGEHQVMTGFNGLSDIELKYFNWYDTGNTISYELTRKKFCNEIVANKTDEALFIDNKKVIKYFDSEQKAAMRYERSLILSDTVPEIKMINKNMYSYDYINGELLSNFRDERIFVKFLQFYKEKFLDKEIQKDVSFGTNCFKMYESKTQQRIKKFKNKSLDKIEIINGLKVEPIDKIVNRIDWDRLYQRSVQSHFHGDLQPENIIYNHKENKFYTIDWRESFGTSKSVGDAYYDLGKIYHALIISGTYMMRGLYSVQYSENEASVEYSIRSNLLSNICELQKFCVENNLSWSQVKLIGILNYVNIAPLYDYFKDGSYGNFLFLLGKFLLTKQLNSEGGDLL